MGNNPTACVVCGKVTYVQIYRTNGKYYCVDHAFELEEK